LAVLLPTRRDPRATDGLQVGRSRPGVIVVAVLVVIAAGVSVVRLRSGSPTVVNANSPGGTGCTAAPPAGASPAARQFLAATAAADVNLAKVGASMDSDNQHRAPR
jgi:hypothetical protein